MGELGDERWAVVSERGCEASGLAYTEAAALMRKLAAEKVYGLCVITNNAARRLPPAESPVSAASQQAGARHNKT